VIGVFPILMSVPHSSSAQFGSADFDRVDAFVEAQLSAANIPGVALAIVRRDGPLHLRGLALRVEATSR
jgi:hypothetical protein